MHHKHELFAQEFIKDLNGSAAAIRAGYGKERARIEASELLARDDVKAYVQELKDERAAHLQVDSSWVLQKLLNIANANVSDLNDGWMDKKEWDEITDEQKEAISEIYTRVKRVPISVISVEGGIQEMDAEIEEIKVKFHDKLKALDSIAKHIGFHEKDNKQKSFAPFVLELSETNPKTD